ncbi:hypothetical protein [Gordonia rubripertincta]|uniref:Uncharacterized protein n=1 Tax=Gordonia rubripertincta TaxID=36822 RepID=A0ABT4N2Y0_GORRU|nr:hypothetical protein [Gordonia rubripertincta]MCZ4553634.1 hypothetical protein [Gordonia rubripertincta]
MSFGAGTAFADPEGQGGVTAPPSTGPGQGGVSTPPPAAPEPVAPAFDNGPGSIPDPIFDAPPVYEGSPPDPSYDPSYYQEPPAYTTIYNPLPQGPIEYRPSKPVRPILARPGKIRVGNLTADQGIISDPDARSINRWSAHGESQFARQLIALGVPEDVAARQAAAMVLGAGAGIVVATVLFVPPATIIGALAGLGIGSAVAPFVPPFTPVAPLIGAGAGAAGGAATGFALALAVGGGTGTALGWLFGAGDPGTNGDAPAAPGTPESELSEPEPPNPDANQYELNADGLPGNGSVSYVVNAAGDVSGSVDVGQVSVPLEWSAEQADAPYQAIGFLAQTARDTVADVTAQVSTQIEQVIPGVRVEFPQFAPADK